MGQSFSGVYMGFQQAWPPKPKWSTEQIPDLSGKVMLVTGANTGIGYETVKELLKKNAKVYMACRSEEKTQTAIARLKEETGKEALFLQLDLADLKAIKKSAEDFLSKETQLDVLFNNGGVAWPSIDLLTKDGYDLQFGTNCLGHFYFTKLLLPLLIESAKTAPDHKARIVNVSSTAQYFGKLDFETFKDGPKRRKLTPDPLYHQSKIGNVVFARELARRYGDQGIVSTSLNPGNLVTELTRHIQEGVVKKLIIAVCYPVPLGALTSLRAGTSPEGADWNGEFLIPWARIGDCGKRSKDPKLGEQLWDWLEEQVKDV